MVRCVNEATAAFYIIYISDLCK